MPLFMLVSTVALTNYTMNCNAWHADLSLEGQSFTMVNVLQVYQYSIFWSTLIAPFISPQTSVCIPALVAEALQFLHNLTLDPSGMQQQLQQPQDVAEIRMQRYLPLVRLSCCLDIRL